MKTQTQTHQNTRNTNTPKHTARGGVFMTPLAGVFVLQKKLLEESRKTNQLLEQLINMLQQTAVEQTETAPAADDAENTITTLDGIRIKTR